MLKIVVSRRSNACQIGGILPAKQGGFRGAQYTIGTLLQQSARQRGHPLYMGNFRCAEMRRVCQRRAAVRFTHTLWRIDEGDYYYPLFP